MKTNLSICFLVILFFGRLNIICAQDVIILTTGDEILSKVIEVGIDIIKYKKFENQEGPLYTIEKAKIFMIKYENGSKDVFTQPKADVTTKQDTVKVKTAVVTPPPALPRYLSYNLGVKLDNKRLTDNQVTKMYANHSEALNLYENGMAIHSVAEVFSYLQIGTLLLTALIAYKAPDLAQKNIIAKRGIIAVGGMMVLGVSCNISGHSKKRKSVESYNAEIKKIIQPSN